MAFPENILNSRLNITLIVLLISTQRARMSRLKRGDGGGDGGVLAIMKAKKVFISLF